MPDALPNFAQALESETLRPVRPEDFYDLTNPPEKAEELTSPQRQTLFRQAFFEESVTLEDLSPYRIRVAWRVVREMLRLRGVHDDQTLAALAPSQQVVDPWQHLRTDAPRRFCTGPAGAVLPILDVADRLDPPGLPLLPPLAPAGASSDYRPGNPEHDPRLHLYVNAFSTIATYLGIREGSKTEPRLGRYGLLGLENPLTVRLTFPTRLQLVQYERILVQETLNHITQVGRLECERILYEKHGLVDDEIALLFRFAVQRARALTKTDADEDKSIVVLMLQDIIRRAREVGSIKNELAAIKQLSIVQSLAKIDPEDINADFEAIVKRFEDDDRPPLQLPG